MDDYQSFVQGAVFLAARLVEMYDQPTMAMTLLEQMDITSLEYELCSEDDLKTLRKENKSIPKGV